MKLTNAELIALWIVIGMLVIMTLVPPYHSHAGYRLLFVPPGRARVDLTRLGIQWALVILLGVVTIFTMRQLRRRRQEREEPRSLMSTNCDIKLTNAELVVLWVGIGTIVLMGLFPPCYGWSLGGLRVIIDGYDPPRPAPSPGDYRPLFSLSAYKGIDLRRLALQWFLVALTTATVIFTMRQLRHRR